MVKAIESNRGKFRILTKLKTERKKILVSDLSKKVHIEESGRRHS